MTAAETAEGDDLVPFDWNLLYGSMSPASQRNLAREMRVHSAQRALFRRLPWLRWPLLNYVYSFWSLLFEEGPRNTFQPYWGGIAFGYLNDGMKPTLWHTWQLVMHPRGPYDGIYMEGAPRNRAEADAVRDGRDPRYPNYEIVRG